MPRKSVADEFVNSWSTILIPFAFATFMNCSATPCPYAVRSSITAAVFAFSVFAAKVAIVPPSCSSLAPIRKMFLKPCLVSAGFDATGSIGTPAVEYTRDAGIATPELYGPSTATTPLSTRFCATCTPAFGSAWSSSETSLNVTVLPATLMPALLSSSTASRAPFSLSLPFAACGPVSGAEWPIITTSCACAEVSAPAAMATESAVTRCRMMSPDWFCVKPM